MFCYHTPVSPDGHNGIRCTVVGELKEGTLNVAVARNNLLDPFSKKRGYAIAKGRLGKGKVFKSYVIDEVDKFRTEDFISLAKTLATEVLANVGTHGFKLS